MSKPKIVNWTGKKPTREELQKILREHKMWIDNKKHKLPPHDLSGAILAGVDFSNHDLRNLNFSGADLRKANFSNTNLFSTNFSNADLRWANFSTADTSFVKYNRNTKFLGCQVATCYGSQRFRRFAQDQDYLEEMQIEAFNARSKWKWFDELCRILGPKNIQNRLAKLCGFFQKISERFNLKNRIVPLATPVTKLAERWKIKQRLQRLTWGEIKYGIWWITCDCGRSFTRWAFCSFILALIFAGFFSFHLGVESFDIHRTNTGQGLPKNFWTLLYYSVVTFTTLGFGDVVPLTPSASRWVMAEVITGYIMLGGLISILATKLARRS